MVYGPQLISLFKSLISMWKEIKTKKNHSKGVMREGI